MGEVPRVEWRCAHRGAARERHLDALAAIRARLARPDGGASAPLVAVQCGDGRPSTADAPRGCEIVRVRLDGEGALDQASALVRAAVRFAEAAGDLRPPRRGLLSALRPPPRLGWAPLGARLEALLEDADRLPVALLLWERPSPPAPDDALEIAQPADPGVLPLELPGGALDVGIVLRAVELGAAAVCAIVPAGAPEREAAVEGAIAVARAVGEGDRVIRAASLPEALERLRAPRRPVRGASGRVARDPTRRPAPAAVALELWRRRAPEGTCAGCGAAWPEAACLAAIEARLSGSPALLAFLASCPECRSGAWGARRPRGARETGSHAPITRAP